MYLISERRVVLKVPRKQRPQRLETKLHDFDKATLLCLVLNFYTKANPEIPTVTRILTEALLIPGFPQLNRIASCCALNKLGFVCKKRNEKC